MRERIRSSQVVVGSWLCSGSPVVAELMAANGLDFLCVDAEHSAVDLPATQALFQAIRSGNRECAPLVRLHGVDYALVKRYMDAGARGVVAPLVCRREDAETLIKAVKYPPLGERGVGFCRANEYGLRLQEEFDRANEETLVVVQIEHIKAVENIDEILSVEGVDAAFVGPFDLSASMGITAQFTHPDYLEAKKRILAACQRHGVAPGIHVVQPDVAQLAEAVEQGFKLIAYSLDITILNDHLKGALPKIEELSK